MATFYQTKDPTLVSKDGHAMLIPVVMAGDLNTAIDNVDELHAVVTAGRDGDFTLQQTGAASLKQMGNELAESDMQKTEVFGVPAALVVLVVVFGALLAAFMPLVLSILSIILALALTALIGQLYPMNTFVLNILTTMGLAVGIDYTLFIISRYREERARGLEKIDAIAATGASANRAIFFSGMTVMLAMLGMVVVPIDLTISMGIGAMLVVFTTLLTSLILLPALLGLLGDRVNALRVPFMGRFATRRANGHGGVWERLSHSIMRRPVIWLATAVTLLLLAASPIVFMQTGSTAATAAGYPDDQYAKQGWDTLDRDFSLGKAEPRPDRRRRAGRLRRRQGRRRRPPDRARGRRPLRAGAGRREQGRRPDRALGAARRRPCRRGGAGRHQAPARQRRAGRLRRHRRPRVHRGHDGRRGRLPRLLRPLAADRPGRRPEPELRAPARSPSARSSSRPRRS